jgi:hypothetical protein
MESMDPRDAAAALEQARLAQGRMAANLRLPGWFYGSIGVTIAVQILTIAIGVVIDSAQAHLVLVAGPVLFVATAAIQLTRFRNLNGVWVSGLLSQVVLGSATTASAAYAAGLTGALWAGFAGYWWLSVVCAMAGGAGYIVGGVRWMRLYRGDPQVNARAESMWWALVLVALAGAGLFLLSMAR